MTLSRNAARALALAAALALGATACGGGDDKPNTPGANNAAGGQGTKGGTLRLLNDTDYEHIDPQRTYVGNALNFTERFMTRTLTAYDTKPGPDGSKIVADMATDLGRPSNENKTWEFTIKDGVKFEDGTAVTCEDIKYGISRTFSDQITEGPQYAKSYLAIEKKPDGSPVYKGPYVGGPNGGFDQAVQCKDPKTIVFNLANSVGDFNYTVTMPAFAPVQKAKDKGTQYDRSVQATGPYKIQTYTPQKTLVLVRNDQWDPKTDTLRKAYPDKIEVIMGLTASVIDSRLIADAPADQTAVMNSTNIQPENLTRVLSNPQLKQRTVSGLDGFTLYLSINTSKVKDLKVRQAIQAGLNRQTYRGAIGGEATGDYATSNITPALTSHKKFTIGDTPPTGDANKAKQLLTEAGVQQPYPLKFDFRNRAATAKAAAAIKAALDAGGFKVTLNPLGPDGYYTIIGKAANQGDITLAGWGPDWPNGSSVIPPLYDGRQIAPEGNQNFAQLNDPEVNAAIDAANKETNLEKQAQMWGDLDEMIVVKKAAVVPLIYSKTNQLFGSKVKNAYLHAFYGEIDLANLSVA